MEYYESQYNNNGKIKPTPPRVNKVAIAGLMLTLAGFALIFNPLDIDIILYVAWLMIVGGIITSIAAWAFQPRWMAALGCVPGMLVAALFIIIALAAGQYRPPQREFIDSLLEVSDDMTVDDALDSVRTHVDDALDSVQAHVNDSIPLEQ